MADKRNLTTDPVEPMIYQIKIKGHLGPQWTDWFGGMTVSLEDNGETLITGPVVDQAALYGLLRKVRDLGLPLLLVVSLKPDPMSSTNAEVETPSLGSDPLINGPYQGNELKE